LIFMAIARQKKIGIQGYFPKMESSLPGALVSQLRNRASGQTQCCCALAVKMASCISAPLWCHAPMMVHRVVYAP
jgi:hypothetical protein